MHPKSTLLLVQSNHIGTSASNAENQWGDALQINNDKSYAVETYNFCYFNIDVLTHYTFWNDT